MTMHIGHRTRSDHRQSTTDAQDEAQEDAEGDALASSRRRVALAETSGPVPFPRHGVHAHQTTRLTADTQLR
jgi:DNA-nicking Smr family endonuclease